MPEPPDPPEAPQPPEPPEPPEPPQSPGSVDVFNLPGTKRQQSGRRLAVLAAKQHGVVAVQQLRRLGFTHREIQGSIAAGRLHRLHRGVYAVGHLKLTRDGRLAAALLAAGEGAFLSHRTAAALHGLRNLNLRRIDVSVVGQGARARQGLQLHRTTVAPVRGEFTRLNGLRISTVPRLLVELASTESRAELGRLISEAGRRRVLDHGNMRAAIRRHAGRPGVRRLAAYQPHPDRKSGLERAFDRLLAEHPEIPEPLRNVHLDMWELDCYWPEQRVALELDGRPYHLVVEDIERDRRKDAYLLTRDIRPLRVTDTRFSEDPQGALDDLRRLLQLG